LDESSFKSFQNFFCFTSIFASVRFQNTLSFFFPPYIQILVIFWNFCFLSSGTLRSRPQIFPVKFLPGCQPHQKKEVEKEKITMTTTKMPSESREIPRKKTEKSRT